MDGCERCMPSWQAGRTWADCDLLDTYGLLCYAMPGACMGAVMVVQRCSATSIVWVLLLVVLYAGGVRPAGLVQSAVLRDARLVHGCLGV
jgi:hypothetical protein